MKTGTKKKSKITCLNCKHYYITWDKHFPYGCRALGFKTKRLPSIVVKESSDMDCLMFEKKKSQN